MIHADSIASLLTTRRIGKPITWQQNVVSTNDELRRRALGGAPEGEVFGAEYQSGGKGRFQRVWQSAAGENLLFSIFLRPPIPPQQYPLFNFLAALAVTEAVDSCSANAAMLRWPNDVYLNGRKICGILSETLPNNSGVIIGIGVNVNQTNFHPELHNATSIAIESGRETDRGRLLHIILKILDERYAAVIDEGWASLMDDWRSRWDGKGKQVEARNGHSIINGTAIAVADDGALRIIQDNGTEIPLYAGDVTLHGTK